MAKGDHTDLFMIFKDDRGRPIEGQSTSELTSSDQISKGLLKGFTAKHIFEIDSFSLSANSDEKDEAEIRKDIEKQNAKPAKPAPGAKPTATTPMSVKEINDEVKKRLAQQKGPPVREVTFKRSVDSSSGPFLSNLIIGQGYESASLVKRKATGGKTAAQADMAGDVYLRIDFGLVLVTDIEWDNDDEEVTENITFICRTINIQYRPQLPNGTLGAIKNGTWTWQTPPPGSTT
jgi:type VI protein secretion system component Hcp